MSRTLHPLEATLRGVGNRVVGLVIALTAIGLIFGLGSITVMLQDNGSCPANVPTCDHAYFVNGSYVWMQPLYTELGLASLTFLASAAVLAFYFRFRSKMTPTQLRILSVIMFLLGFEWFWSVYTGTCACPIGVACNCLTPFAQVFLVFVGIAIMIFAAVPLGLSFRGQPAKGEHYTIHFISSFQPHQHRLAVLMSRTIHLHEATLWAWHERSC